MLIKTLENFHINPLPLDVQTEKRVFDLFIRKLDPDGIFFTTIQIDSLYAFVNDILDTNQNRSCVFLKEVTKVYKQRIILADQQMDRISKSPLTFTTLDTVYFSRKHQMLFAKEESALEKRRVKLFKYYFLDEFFSNLEDSLFDGKQINLRLRELEKEIRENVVKATHCQFMKIFDGAQNFEDFVLSKYFDAIALSFDPHSCFFTMPDLKAFSAQLSSESGTYGISLESDRGKLKISKLIPGGSAWKSNMIHKGDLLEKITTVKAKYEDFTCMNADEAERLMDYSEGNWVELEIRSKDGKIQKVKLIKEVTRVEENKVNSCILEGNVKAGYIALPDFYTGGELMDGPGCANDVAKEILKMRKSGIDGLIFDLRYNGGGSVKEALDLAGLFIDIGPVGIVRIRNGRPQILKDQNRGTVYNGNVVVLVNGFSASASELVAITLQDYNRAVIAGQPTFGKATAQEVIPLDEYSPEKGYIKYTYGKLYRLNGESTQLKGVSPDIWLPDLYGGIMPREEEELYVLQSDTINKTMPYPRLPFLPLDSLKSKSENRLSKNSEVATLSRKNLQMKSYYKKSGNVVLEPESFFQWMSEYYALFESEQEKIDTNKIFKVVNNTFDNDLMKFDEYAKEIINYSNKRISTDIQIAEAYSILNDLIDHSK